MAKTLQIPEDAARKRNMLRKVSRRAINGKAFIVKTGPIKLFAKVLRDLLSDGALGMMLYGRPRLGKTMAARWALGSISKHLNGLPYLEIPVRDIDPDEAATDFFEYILTLADHKYASKGRAGQKLTRLVNWMAVRAKRSRLETFVLFFDEANRLQDRHYEWLLSLSNELNKKDVAIFVLLVGQPSLLGHIERTIVNSHSAGEQIVGRFMSTAHEFSPLRNVTEVEECLAGFDGVEYPLGSQTMFPATFAPNNYSNGFRLVNHAQAIWDNCNIRWQEIVNTPTEISMAYMTRMIQRILNDLAETDSDVVVSAQSIDLQTNRSVDAAQVLRAIDKSGFDQSARIRSATLAAAAVKRQRKDK